MNQQLLNDSMTKESYQLIFSGTFLPDQVRISEQSSSRKIDPILEEDCRRAWEKASAEARVQGKKFWDSDVYRFEGFRKQSGCLTLAVSTIPYSIRISMNNFTEEIRALGIEYASLGMFSSIFLQTKDHRYVFLEKSDKYVTNRKYSFVGGLISKSEKRLFSGGDLFSQAAKEIKEETGAPKSMIKNLMLMAGYISENYNLCLLFTADIEADFAQLLEEFNIRNDGEASRLVGIPKPELLEFISQLPTKDWPKFNILNLD